MNKSKIALSIITYLLCICIAVGIGFGGYYLIKEVMFEISDLQNPNNSGNSTIVDNKISPVDPGIIPISIFHDYNFLENDEVYSAEYVSRELTKEAVASNTDKVMIMSNGKHFQYRISYTGTKRIYLGNVLPNTDYENYTVTIYEALKQVREVNLSADGSFEADGAVNIMSVKYKGTGVVINALMHKEPLSDWSLGDGTYARATNYIFMDNLGNYIYGFADYSMLEHHVVKYKLKPATDDITPISYDNNYLLNAEGIDKSIPYTNCTWAPEAGDIYKKNLSVNILITLYNNAEQLNTNTKVLYLGNLFPGYKLEECALLILKLKTDGSITRERYYLDKNGFIKLNVFEIVRINALAPEVNGLTFDLNNLIRTTKNYYLNCEYKFDDKYYAGFLTYSDLDKFIKLNGTKVVDALV